MRENYSFSSRQKYGKVRHSEVRPNGPSVRNSTFYGTDEFQMFGFKVKPCPLSRPPDWTECPYAHHGEKARRRDPTLINYLAIACPEHRANPGECLRGELCGFAHGIFESWLHPAKYRTRPCNAGLRCKTNVCFFAHGPQEFRRGVNYGVYRGRSASAAGLLPLPGEAAGFGKFGVRSDWMDVDPEDVDWVWKLID